MPRKGIERRAPRRIARRLSDRDREALAASYQLGSSIKALARTYAISEYSVREILVSSGLKGCTSAVTTSQIDRIVTLHEEGAALDVIAKSVRSSVGTVRIVLAAQTPCGSRGRNPAVTKGRIKPENLNRG